MRDTDGMCVNSSVQPVGPVIEIAMCVEDVGHDLGWEGVDGYCWIVFCRSFVIDPHLGIPKLLKDFANLVDVSSERRLHRIYF